MLTKFKSNRLGEILVRKGIITQQQLKIAIHEQNHRRKVSNTDKTQGSQSTCLGKILTELGFIDQTQLKRGLNWQAMLRKITMTLALCTPLMGAVQAKAATSPVKAPLAIPATIEAEDFSANKGTKREITTDVGGGIDVGSIDKGDWLNYLNTPVAIPATGDYIVSFRVASLRGGASLSFYSIGTNSTITNIDTISVPQTGGWQTWVTVQRKVTLKAGTYYFGLQAITAGANINWFKITSVAAAAASTKPTSSTAAVSSAKSSSLSSVASSKSSSVASSAKSSAPTSSKVSSSASSKAVSVVSSSSKSSSSSSSVKSSSSSSKSSAASSVPAGYVHLAGPVGLSWIAPKQREDKTLLDIIELGGYQIRYKTAADSKYTYIVINDAWTTTYNFSWLEGDYAFQIAAFDKLGILSDFSDFQ